jgi:hypothetical protein
VLKLVTALASAAEKTRRPETVAPFLASLLRHAASRHVLSSAHLLYVKSALAAHDYVGGATAVEDFAFFDVAPSTQPRDVLLYHYNAGLLLCGAERWAQASGMFKTVSGLCVAASAILIPPPLTNLLHPSKQCLSLPGPATADVQHEAFKKALLILCIDPCNVAQASGDLHVGPVVLINSVPRHRREALASQGRPYMDLAKAVAGRDATAARAIAAEQSAVFEKDGNMGLVRATLDVALPFRQLLQLRRVYSTVYLSTVAEALGFTSTDAAAMAEAAVLRAVNNNPFHAKMPSLRVNDPRTGTCAHAQISRGGLVAHIDKLAGAVSFSPHDSSSEGLPGDSSALSAHVQSRIDVSGSSLDCRC